MGTFATTGVCAHCKRVEKGPFHVSDLIIEYLQGCRFRVEGLLGSLRLSAFRAGACVDWSLLRRKRKPPLGGP